MAKRDTIVKTQWTRRDVMAAIPATLGAGALAGSLSPDVARAEAEAGQEASPFGFCLNTSTLMGQKLPIDEVITIAAKAGYTGLEPWIRELDQYVQAGGSLKDLGKKIRDLGLTVSSAIGFFDWAVDDEGQRRKAFDEAKRNMDLVRQIGGLRLAAPPGGATDRSDLDLRRIAERYRALLQIGDTMGVVPQVEVWGFSKTLGKLSEAAFVAIEANHPRACILPDVYHLYRGGSGFEGLKLLGKDAIHVFHLNDYPASPPRAEITDSARVYPGDGIAPLGELFKTLRAIGFRGMLSLELFNRDLWKQDPMTVARTGLEKMRTAVQKGLS